jgi:PKD repeat protein
MRFLVFVICIGLASGLFAQTNYCRKSTEGTDFWFGFMESRNYQESHFLEITVTAKESTTLQIFIGPDETPFGETYTLNANIPLQVEIPWEMAEATGSEEIQDKGIHLTSEKPVNIYALNWSQNSADVAVIYPVGSLGTEYFAMCYYPDIDLVDPVTGNGRNSEFLIVASEDSTLVEITPSRVTDKNSPKDSTFSVLLNKGQVYQVQSQNIVGTHIEGQGDLTGSYISANKPVAFYSGSLSTRIPTGQCCWDHLYEQIPPLHSWGLEYYLTPLKTREQDRYRIMAAQNNTTLFITGRTPVTLQRGEFEEVVVYHNDPKRLLADKPVMVAQFSQSRNVDTDFTGGDGDPFMIILSPVNQSRNEAIFVAYKSPELDIEGYEGITKYFVNIVTPTSEIENIRLNDEPVETEFQTLPGNLYSFAQIQIDAGTNHIKNINEESGFLAYAYGFGGVESFGYGVGFNLDLTLDLGESIEFLGDTLLLCFGDSLTLDAGYYFDTFQWNSGETTQTIQVFEEGWKSVKTTTIDGCELEDSVFIFVSKPFVQLDQGYLEECMPFELELSAEDDYSKYLWQNEHGDTLSTAQHFTANKTGNYSITVFDQYNCTASDNMELIIFPVPEIEFLGSSQICGEKTANIAVSATGTPDSIWNYDGGVEWKTNKPTELTFKNKTNTTTEIEVNEWGNYEIYFHLKTIDGCEKTDTFFIRFHPDPTADFILDNDEKCEGYSQILTFTGTATDSASFHWDLSGSQFLDTLDWQKYLVSVGAFLEEPPFISLFIDDNGCFSDTVFKPVGAKPNFTMEADKRRGCDELEVNFSSQLLTADQVNFEWEFDDGQISTEQNLTRFYNEPGFYDVKLTITNPVTQCTNSFSIDSMIKVFPTPVAAIKADPDFCYPESTELIYPNNIDSTVCHWEFEGMHQIGTGNDSITVIFDKPTALVRLVVDEFGCFSEPAEMQLKRKPLFDFSTENNEGCLPFEAEIFAESPDNDVHFYWISDSLPYPESNSKYFSSTEPGEFSVGLIAHSDETGCSDTLIKTNWIKVYPNPVADFRVNYPVAMVENASLSYKNWSEGADIYSWEFGDGNSSSEENPTHTFTEPGEYLSRLTAESMQGCTDTSELLITILPSTVYSPNAFRPDSPIEENRSFMPIYAGADPSRFKLEIYDRRGQLVFETKSPDASWDGTLPNGKPAAMGNYVWIAIYSDIQGFEQKQKGQVLLIR